jgi:4-hydroxybenzoate polyprenyltransferase
MTNDGSRASEEAQAAPPAAKRLDSPGAWVCAGVLGFIAAYALYGSFDFAIEIRRWPLGLSVVILVCLAIYAVQQALLARADQQDPSLRDLDRPQEYRPRATAITVVATLAFTLFLVAAYLFSFLLATAVFLPAYMLAAGERRPLIVAGVTVGMLLAVWFMFGGLLNAPVEVGALVSLDWLLH